MAGTTARGPRIVGRRPRRAAGLRRLALAGILGGLAAAAAATGTRADDRCDDPGTTARMVECADAAFRAADARLNAVYRDVMARLKAVDEAAGDGADRAGKLRAAQRAWIPLRDAQCTLEAAAAYGGTLAPVLEIGCRTRMTEDRTEALRSVADDYDS